MLIFKKLLPNISLYLMCFASIGDAVIGETINLKCSLLEVSNLSVLFIALFIVYFVFILDLGLL